MKYVNKIIMTLILVLCISFIPAGTTHAAGIQQIDAFNSLDGDGKYLNNAYRDNYYLDIEECGLLESHYEVLNSIANILFSLVKSEAYILVTVLYHALTLDISNLFSDQINSIQKALHDSVFQPLLIIGLVGSAITVIKRLLQQNTIGIVSELGKIILLITLSMLLMTQSSVILTYVSGTTKSISLSALNGMNGIGGESLDLTGYAANTAGVLWKNLLHEPWLTLEFGGSTDVSSDLVQSLLTNAPDSDARAAIIEENEELFPKSRALMRIGNLIIFNLVLAVKAVFFLVICLIMFAFQLFAVFYLLIAPLVLVLAFFPIYNSIINTWFKKFMESQVCIFIISLILGLIIKFDSILFGMSGSLGWLIVLIFQVAVMASLYFGREKILNAFGNVQRAIENPAYANAMFRNSGNLSKLNTYVPEKYNKLKSYAHSVGQVGSALYQKHSSLAQDVDRHNEKYMKGSTVTKSAPQSSGPQRPNLARNMQQRQNIVSYDEAATKFRLKVASEVPHSVSSSIPANGANLSQSINNDRLSQTPKKEGTSSELFYSVIQQSLTRDNQASAPSVPGQTRQSSQQWTTATTVPQKVKMNVNATRDSFANMRMSDDKTILTQTTERPISTPIETPSTDASYALERPSISKIEDSAPYANNLPITGNETATSNTNGVAAPPAPTKHNNPSTNTPAQLSTQKSSGRQQFRSANSFTGTEVNVPVSKSTKIERPKLNTGIYKEDISSKTKKAASQEATKRAVNIKGSRLKTGN